MTDNEIKKALECCTKRENQCCNDAECPLYYKTETYSECRWKLLKGTTDLINRLQAENERLYGDIMTYKLRWAKATAKLDTAKAEAYKEFFQLIHNELVDISNGYFESVDLKACEVLQVAIDKLRETYKEMVGKDK